MWLPRHVAVAATWLPRGCHVMWLWLPSGLRPRRQLTNCTVCTRDELSGTWMAQWRHRGNEERDPPVGTIATREVLSISPLRFKIS